MDRGRDLERRPSQLPAVRTELIRKGRALLHRSQSLSSRGSALEVSDFDPRALIGLCALEGGARVAMAHWFKDSEEDAVERAVSGNWIHQAMLRVFDLDNSTVIASKKFPRSPQLGFAPTVPAAISLPVQSIGDAEVINLKTLGSTLVSCPPEISSTLRSFEADRGSYGRALVSPGGEVVAGKSLSSWDPDDGPETRFFWHLDEGSAVTAFKDWDTDSFTDVLALSNDGSRAALTVFDGTGDHLEIRDTRSAEVVTKLPLSTAAAGAQPLGDDRMVVFEGDRLHFLDVRKGEIVRIVPANPDGLEEPGLPYLWSATNDGSALAFSIRSPTGPGRQTSHLCTWSTSEGLKLTGVTEKSLLGLSISPCGGQLFTYSGDGVLRQHALTGPDH